MMVTHSALLSGAIVGKDRLFGGKQLLFLATKVVPPRSPGLIDRPRLLAMAAQLPAKRLAVIKAPAGFGKTSLALSWSEWLHRRGSSVAWLAIDSDDDEPPRFFFYVTQAMHRATPGGAAEQDLQPYQCQTSTLLRPASKRCGLPPAGRALGPPGGGRAGRLHPLDRPRQAPSRAPARPARGQGGTRGHARDVITREAIATPGPWQPTCGR